MRRHSVDPALAGLQIFSGETMAGVASINVDLLYGLINPRIRH